MLARLLLVGAIAGTLSRSDPARDSTHPSSPCLSNADTVELLAPLIAQRASLLTPSELASVGLGAAPSGVTLVTDSMVCAAAVAAANSVLATFDSTKIMSAAYVFGAGSAYILTRLADGPGLAEYGFLLDSTATVKVGWEFH